MIKIQRTITIHRPVEQVFEYLSNVEHGPRYISGQRRARQTSAGPMGVGTTFATRGRFLPGSRTSEVTEYELNRRLAWRTVSGTRETTTWDFQVAGPSTRVTFDREADVPAMLKVAESLLAQRAGGRVDHDLGTLKELLAVTRKPANGAQGSW